MQASWESLLNRWREASLIDEATFERIRAYEQDRFGIADINAVDTRGLRWPIILALVFGCLLLAAGALLFVAAHWDDLSPGWRFTLVLSMVSLFHLVGAATREKFEKLSIGVHSVGTIALGAGIFLGGQIFHLEEHWPGGIMLWAMGAWLAYFVLRDWTQFTLAAMLTPAWLAGEWEVATKSAQFSEQVLAQGLLLLSITYLSAQTPEKRSLTRRALQAVGVVTFIPLAVWTILESEVDWWWRRAELPLHLHLAGAVLGFGLPILFAYLLRGRLAWMNVVAALWVLGLAKFGQVQYWEQERPWLHFWNLIGSALLTYWGVREADKRRINLGIGSFGLSVMTFYFSSVFDMLGRATAMFSLGLIFLLGGWALERTRRKLVSAAVLENGGQG